MDLSKLKLTITNMYALLENCINLVSINFGDLHIGEVESMAYMFKGCKKLESLNLSKFNTKTVRQMNNMFEGAESLKSLDLSNFDTSKVSDMTQMFYGCNGLVSLDISNFNFELIREPDNEQNDQGGSGEDVVVIDGRRIVGNEQEVDSGFEIQPPYFQMFYGLTNLKYINLINVNDPNEILLKTDLINMTDLIACQNKIIIEKATNQCCIFDIEALKCETSSNNNEISTTNIVVTTEVVKETEKTIKKTTSLSETSKTEAPIINPSDIPIIPKFTIGSINQDGCEKTGKLILNGENSGTINKKFTIYLAEPSGISLSCKLINDKLECETDRVINDKIRISQTNISENGKNVLLIEEFSPEEQITCANALLDKVINKLPITIYFRQVSHFQTNDQDTSFSFYLITLMSEALSKGYSLNLKMEMYINEIYTEKNAVCILENDVNPNSGELAKGNFLCTVKLTSDEYNNIDFDSIKVSSENEEINGLNGFDDDLYYPKKTDETIKLIREKKANGEDIYDLENIIDYYEEDTPMIPFFTINSINASECSSEGKFIMSGYFSEDMNESLKFDFFLDYPASEVKCEFDEAEKNEIIEMTCKLHFNFRLVESFIIEQKLIKKKYKEIFVIQQKQIDFPENIECNDYNSFKIPKIEKRSNSDFSFIQLNNFNPEQNQFSFFMALSLINNNAAFLESYPLTAEINSPSRRRLRNLVPISGFEIGCNLDKNLQTNKAAGYNCQNKQTPRGIPKSMKIETDNIYIIQGIPDNANPYKMNNKMNYSNLDNLKLLEGVTNANINSIEGTNCSEDGQYIVKATLESNTKIDGTYGNIELRFGVPESSGICIAKIINTNVEMTCQNKEKFYESPIYIERQLIQDNNGKPLFFINYYKSSNNLECDISLKIETFNPDSSDKATDKATDTDTISEVNNNLVFSKKSSRGLNGGLIAGIVVAIVAAIAVIGIVVVLAKKGVLCFKNNKYKNNEKSVSSISEFKFQNIK